MKSVQKVALSLLVTVIVFSGFTVLAFSGLFEFVETRFYNQRITDNLLSELDDAAGTLEEFNRKYIRSFRGLLEQDYIKRSYLPNQSTEDITERRQRVSYLEKELSGFLFTRFVDSRGRIHFSSLESDIAERQDFAITYKRFEEVETGGDVENYLVREMGAEEIIIDRDSGTLIYSFPFFDILDIYKGSALFYVSVRSLRDSLMQQNIILPGESLGIVGSRGFVIDLPEETGPEVRDEIIANWNDTGSFDDKITLMGSEDGRRYVLLSTVTQNGVWLGHLVDSERFTLNTYLRIILLASFFIAFFMILFLILSFRQDKLIVLSERIKRFQINFLKEYVEKSDYIDKDVWRRDIASKKGLVSREIKRGIGNLKPGQEVDVDALIDRSWDEILNVIGSKVAEHRIEGTEAASAIKLENLERALEKVLQSGSLVVRTEGTAEVSKPAEAEAAEAPKARETAPLEAPPGGLGKPIEVEDVEDVEDFEEAEAIEEVEFVEEVEESSYSEETERTAAPEAAEAVEEIDEVEPAEELPEEGESLEIEELDRSQEESAEELAEAEPIEYVEEEPEELEELEEVVLETAEAEEGRSFTAAKPEELGDFEEPEPEEVEDIPEESPEQFEEPEEEAPESPEEVEEPPYEEVHPEEIEEAEEYIDTEAPEEVEPAREEEEVEDVEEIDEEYDEVEELVPLPDFYVTGRTEEPLEELETPEMSDEAEEMVLERVSGGYSFFGNYGDGFYGTSVRADWKMHGGEFSELEELDEGDEIDEIDEIEEAEDVTPEEVESELTALIKKGLIEIMSIDDILGKLDNLDRAVEVIEGVFTITEKVFETPSGDIKDENLKTLADEVLGEKEEQTAPPDTDEEGHPVTDDSSIGELFSYSDVELPVEFGEIVEEEEARKDISERREFCLQNEGFNLDIFIRYQSLSQQSGPIKSLLFLSRNFGALFGAVLVPKGNEMLPELTIGLDADSISSLRFDSQGDLARLVVDERNLSLVKISRINNPKYKPAVSENDRRYLSSLFLIPGIFDEKPMILLLGIKSDTLGLDRLVEQLIEMC